MAAIKDKFVCTECGSVSSKWAGQCASCEGWNTLTQQRSGSFTGNADSVITALQDISTQAQVRMITGISELDRVLGGGLVNGSVVLIGGDPGIGKSTVLLQALAFMSNNFKTLYVTGEESLQQVKLRADRLGCHKAKINLLAQTQIEKILLLSKSEQPKIIVLDSIQTLSTELLQSAPGSVSQVRESAACVVRFAKQTGTTVLLVGHVTKEGALAGPRILEHMVDTVLYFEGNPDSKYRVIRAVKNRFGAVNELGIFAMTDKGLKEVSNPSAIFLSNYITMQAGSVVMVTWEGSRPLLVEIQCLANESHLGNPRRLTVGLDHNRLALVLAVLHRHGNISTSDQDVFINVVGGVRVTETGIDLPVALAVFSSLENKPLPADLVCFGEIGLSGEVRPVVNGQDRIKEAVKLGFKRAIIPHANAPKKNIKNIEVIPVKFLKDILEYVR